MADTRTSLLCSEALLVIREIYKLKYRFNPDALASAMREARNQIEYVYNGGECSYARIAALNYFCQRYVILSEIQKRIRRDGYDDSGERPLLWPPTLNMEPDEYVAEVNRDRTIHDHWDPQ
jgi:hypothetical protein